MFISLLTCIKFVRALSVNYNNPCLVLPDILSITPLIIPNGPKCLQADQAANKRFLMLLGNTLSFLDFSRTCNFVRTCVENF